MEFGSWLVCALPLRWSRQFPRGPGNTSAAAPWLLTLHSMRALHWLPFDCAAP